MGGAAARRKGAKGELEVIKILQPIVDRVYAEAGKVAPVLERRQTTQGRFVKKGYDIGGLPWAALEIKRVENIGMIGSWWRQTVEAAREGQTPILIWRQNFGKWRVRFTPILYVGGRKLRATVNVDIGTFLAWFEARVRFDVGADR